jgi:hypothetical protein
MSDSDFAQTAQPQRFHFNPSRFDGGSVTLGRLRLCTFDAVLVRADPTGDLHQRITAALSNDPSLPAAIKDALFPTSGED